MSERISITYTIALDDLNQEIQRLYQEMVSSMGELSDSCSLPDNLLSEPTIRELSRIVDSLKNISHKVLDIENIIKSYLNYVTRPANVQDPQQLENLQNLAKTLNSLNNEDTDLRS